MSKQDTLTELGLVLISGTKLKLRKPSNCKRRKLHRQGLCGHFSAQTYNVEGRKTDGIFWGGE